MKIDVHQHIWTAPLLEALTRRAELPFVRLEHDLTVLFLAGERPYVIDRNGEAAARRAALLQTDGLDGALVCLSSPVGIETLPREQSLELIDAYHEGALGLGDPFGVWGAIALDRPDPADIDRALDLGCVGISIPAGALGGFEQLARLHPLLRRLSERDAPLLIHPGPGGPLIAGETSLGDPLWWPALTRYLAEMQAAWLSFVCVGRRSHPELRVVFAMLAGLAPLQYERLCARGGPVGSHEDRRIFYETSSYGPSAVQKLTELLGAEQILYGSDRPVIDPNSMIAISRLDSDRLAESTREMLGETCVVAR
ncbi:MAG TPA: amidohydrolase family protein [Solirubrobacteraceae bacterium]